MSKFQRNYKLTIQKDGEDEVVISYPLTLDFAITRADLSFSGMASLRVLNVSPETRGLIYKNQTDISTFVKVRLDAGYGDQLATIFDGNASWIRSLRPERSVDYVTEINAYDYGFVISNSRSSFTVQGKAASQDAVIRRLCNDLRYPVDGVQTVMPVGAIGNFDKTSRTKYSVNGPTWDALKTESGQKCFIDNGTVYVLGVNEVVGSEVFVVNSDTGLLGTPKVDGVHITVEMIFEPGLKIGQMVYLDSSSLPDFNGTYKVIGLSHSGSISGAVSGSCKTVVTLMVGSANSEDPFTIVEEGVNG